TGGTADRNRSHWSTSKTPSYTKSVSWQHHRPDKTRQASHQASVLAYYDSSASARFLNFSA
ncbi:hypothetical protein, partial [Shigella sonnei]|uniref:hypothetical protein n=1 Tax=Shigella sonnei TaxID=624 RepID=UPI00147D984E